MVVCVGTAVGAIGAGATGFVAVTGLVGVAVGGCAASVVTCTVMGFRRVIVAVEVSAMVGLGNVVVVTWAVALAFGVAAAIAFRVWLPCQLIFVAAIRVVILAANVVLAGRQNKTATTRIMLICCILFSVFMLRKNLDNMNLYSQVDIIYKLRLSINR